LAKASELKGFDYDYEYDYDYEQEDDEEGLNPRAGMVSAGAAVSG
jgi:hypothetical protein